MPTIHSTVIHGDDRQRFTNQDIALIAMKMRQHGGSIRMMQFHDCANVGQ
jgi:hypothetical protein